MHTLYRMYKNRCIMILRFRGFVNTKEEKISKKYSIYEYSIYFQFSKIFYVSITAYIYIYIKANKCENYIQEFDILLSRNKYKQ